MKAVIFSLTALLLTGCGDVYRYPCQDPKNANNPDCNRPICEVDGFCFDKLNGLPEKDVQEIQAEEAPAAPPAADCNKTEEPTGE
jgi:hypothetical protein